MSEQQVNQRNRALLTLLFTLLIVGGVVGVVVAGFLGGGG